MPSSQPEPALSPMHETARHQRAFRLVWASVFSVFGLGLSNILLGLSVLATPWRDGRARLLEPRFRAMSATLVAYGVLLVLAVAASEDPAASLPDLSELFSLLLVPMIFVLAPGPRRIRQLIHAVVMLASVEAVIGLGQLLVAGGGLHDRIRGTFSHYMTFSGLLLVADLLLLARVATGGRTSRWRWLALVVINLALVGSLTRSAWVGLAAGAACLLFVRRRRGLVIVVALVVVAALIPATHVAERLGSIVDLTDPTNYDRLCMVYAGAQMVLQDPATGLGPGMVGEWYPVFRHPTAPRRDVPHLHNTFLQIAAERGLPALAVYLALMLLGAMRAIAVYRDALTDESNDTAIDIALGCLAVLVAFNVAGLFENNWGDTEVQRVVLVALAAPFCLLRRRERGERDAG